jgi:hypothetical protein
MANEPERLIEKLLRACAKRRRDAAPEGSDFELHPATRRLLQGEVARRFPRRESARSGAAPWWKAALWPRLVEACVLVALIAVVICLLVPGLRAPKGDARLARNEERLESRLNKSSPAPVAAPAPAAVDEAVRRQVDRERFAAKDEGAFQKEAPKVALQSNRSSSDKDMMAQADAAAAVGQRAPATAFAQRELKQDIAPHSAPAAPAEPPTVAAATPAEKAPSVAGAPMPSATLQENEAMGLVQNGNKPVDALTNAFGGVSGSSSSGFVVANQGLTAAQRPSSSTSLFDSSAVSNRQADSLLAGTASDESAQLMQNSTADLAKAMKQEEGFVGAQHFAQESSSAKAKAAESKAAPSVLVSFQVQQLGRELRVIDSDGSVYTGSVQTASIRTRASDAIGQAGATARRFSSEPLPAPPTATRFFRVSGTNRSLNQPVVFSGDLTCLTNGAVGGNLNGVISGGGGAVKPASGALLNARISGQAVIGKDKVIQVNAVPAP